MKSKISRRSVIAGIAVVPFVGARLVSVLAKQDQDSTPVSSPMASPGASPMASPVSEKMEVTIVAEDVKFDTAEICISANTDVQITLQNKGLLDHDFRIDELDFQIGSPLAPGGEKTEILNVDEGQYEYYCTIPGHKEAGMVGILHAE